MPIFRCFFREKLWGGLREAGNPFLLLTFLQLTNGFLLMFFRQ
jgi:hypothetical protein